MVLMIGLVSDGGRAGQPKLLPRRPADAATDALQ